MAISASTPAGLPLYDAVGTLFAATRTITFDSSYVTGGEPMAASLFGLSHIRRVDMPVITTSTGAAAPVIHIRPIVSAAGTVLLKVMWTVDGESDLAEVASTTNLAGLVAVITAYGT